MGQAELVCRKQIKPIELVDLTMDRIERLNPRINAVVTTRRAPWRPRRCEPARSPAFHFGSKTWWRAVSAFVWLRDRGFKPDSCPHMTRCWSSG